MPKRKNFYDDPPVDTGLDLMRERNVESLLRPLTERARPVQREILIDRIRPNPFQARRTFEVGELAAAIRAQGFVSRLRVRPDPAAPGYFELVYGERRLRAAQEAGLREVPCDIVEHSDAEMIEIGLAENIQREDLEPLEEATALQAFLDQRGYSIRSLADRIGKDKGYIENRLALLRVPDDLQRMVAQRPDTMRAARELAKLPSPELRRPVIAGLLDGRLTVSAVSELVRRVTAEPDQAAAIVAASAGAHRPASQERGQRQSPTTPFGREARTLADVLARWRRDVPGLTAEECAALLRVVEEHLEALEQLTEALRDRQVSARADI